MRIGSSESYTAALLLQLLRINIIGMHDDPDDDAIVDKDYVCSRTLFKKF
jgi:hypothetical protein